MREMKKAVKMRTIKGALVVIMLLAMTVSAAAADFTYTPSSIDVTIEPGGLMSVPLELDAGVPIFSVLFKHEVTGIPAGWITPSPDWVVAFFTPAATTLILEVPFGTAPGTYTGELVSRVMSGAHGYDYPGVPVTITVPSQCAEAPTFTITSFGPETLWTPNKSMVELTIQGTIDSPEDCSTLTVTYTVDDEYGEFSGTGQVSVDAGGAFSVVIPIEASRKGQDKDGRHYSISFTATNDAGTSTSQSLEAIVPHDMR